jgi:hypothetical protein
MYINSQIMGKHLEKAKNIVKRLNLSHNNIDNVSFLNGTQLIELNISKNDLADFKL